MKTFYLGKEFTLYEKKYKKIMEHYKAEVETSSKSEIFRHVVDLLYDAIMKNNKKEAKD